MRCGARGSYFSISRSMDLSLRPHSSRDLPNGPRPESCLCSEIDGEQSPVQLAEPGSQVALDHREPGGEDSRIASILAGFRPTHEDMIPLGIVQVFESYNCVLCMIRVG